MTTTTPWTDAFNDVGWHLPDILTPAAVDRAVTHLERYFSTNEAGIPRYAGSFFEQLGGGGDRPETRNNITADDLLALSLLDVPTRAAQAIQLLSPTAEQKNLDLEPGSTTNSTAFELPYNLGQINDLLASIPTDVGLSSRKAHVHLETGNQLWTALRRKNFGPARVSKLIARKRPRLFPIFDAIVAAQLGTDSLNFYENLHTVLQAEQKALAKHLKNIRADALSNSGNEDIGQLSTIRVFDIILWMAGQESKGNQA